MCRRRGRRGSRPSRELASDVRTSRCGSGKGSAERPRRNSCVADFQRELGGAVKGQGAGGVVGDAERTQTADAVVEGADVGIGGISFGRIKGEGVEAGLGGERDAKIQHDFLAGFKGWNREAQLGIACCKEKVAHAVVKLDSDRGQGNRSPGLKEHADGGAMEEFEVPRGSTVTVEDGSGDEL